MFRRVAVSRGSIAALALWITAAPVAAADTPAPSAGETADERFAIHGQMTYVEQQSSSFNAPYHGPNSLTPNQGRQTFDATLYLGARLWSGAEIWANPEIDQGFGLDDTQGLAGFSSGEAYKVGRNEPYFRLQRLFVRETFDLGGDPERVEAGANQFARTHTANRVVVTVGKFSVADIFDTDPYAHDARADFLNWAVIDTATFDYAADAWGYTVGAAVEWYQGDWTLRAGGFDLSDVPNSPHLEPGFHEFQLNGELERRYQLASRPGRVLITGFVSRANMALLDDALAHAQETGGPIDLAAVRQFRSRSGIGLGLQQELAEGFGAFARAGTADGKTEVYDFTDADRTVAAGLSLNGTRWQRALDTFGIAAVINNISATRQRYLAAGGLGILIGDGQLPHPGPEKIVETDYKSAVTERINVTLDYQHVVNPAYNRDRGPVSIWAIRVHMEF
jgi:high affinity Mn2+ porin